MTLPKRPPPKARIRDHIPTVPIVPRRWVFLLFGVFGTMLLSIAAMVLVNPFVGPPYFVFVASFLAFLATGVAAMKWTFRHLFVIRAWNVRSRRVRAAREVGEASDLSLWDASIDGPS